MGLRADSARPQRVSGSARTDSRRAESARNPITAHVKFGDDCANSQPGLSQWTAAFFHITVSPMSLTLSGVIMNQFGFMITFTSSHHIHINTRQLAPWLVCIRFR